MIRFSCDWCSRLKGPQEAWILGIAAETVGYTAVRREATILADWERDRAVLPLAVHFCSTRCKDKYMGQLFDSKVPTEEEVIVERVEPAEVIKRVEPAEVIKRVEPARVTKKDHSKQVGKGNHSKDSKEGGVTQIESPKGRRHRRTA